MAATRFNAEQKEAFKSIQKFLDHPVANVFVLKGYAGIGKTFLMQQLGKWLKETEQPFCLLASTGRSASVLKGKTGFEARTLHSELYNFSKIDGISDEMQDSAAFDKSGQMSMQFLVRQVDEDKMLYIVDKASMLRTVPYSLLPTCVLTLIWVISLVNKSRCSNRGSGTN